MAKTPANWQEIDGLLVCNRPHSLTTLPRRNTMNTQDVIDAIHEERLRQDDKWGTDFSGRWDQEWLEIALEEIGEALDESTASTLRQEELIQCAAVFASWAEHCLTEAETPNTNGRWEPRVNYYSSPITKVISDIGRAARNRLEARYS